MKRGWVQMAQNTALPFLFISRKRPFLMSTNASLNTYNLTGDIWQVIRWLIRYKHPEVNLYDELIIPPLEGGIWSNDYISIWQSGVRTIQIFMKYFQVVFAREPTALLSNITCFFVICGVAKWLTEAWLRQCLPTMEELHIGVNV